MSKESGEGPADIRREMVALYPRLRRFAYGLTGSMDQADDLVQAAYERALGRLDQWLPGTRLDSWMFRIVHTLRINRLRSDRVRGAHLAVVDPDTRQGGDLTREMETGLTLDAVRRFLLTLPADQRAVLMLVCVEGHSYAEAASAMGVPIGTVTSRLGRGRRALREFVEHGEARYVDAERKRSEQ